jgi:hypothetical protein
MNSMDCFIAKGATSSSIKCINGFVERFVPIDSQYLVVSLTFRVNWDHQLRFLTNFIDSDCQPSGTGISLELTLMSIFTLQNYLNEFSVLQNHLSGIFMRWNLFLPFGIISMNFRYFRIISVGFSRGEKSLPFGIISVGFHVKFLHFIVILLSHRIKWGPVGEQLLRCAKPS